MNLYLQRLVIDHDNHPAQLRKALSYKEAVKVHQCCGAYLFLLAKIQKIAPENLFQTISTDLYIQFKAGLLDPDLLHVVETQVPANADIKAVSAFRLAVSKLTRDMRYHAFFEVFQADVVQILHLHHSVIGQIFFARRTYTSYLRGKN